jgi:peptidoglycan/LPS O-acetylase OafA/YrhL
MTKTRVNEIDLLRFIAALAVVLFHLSFRGYAADDMSILPFQPFVSFSKYGYLGVDLFFLISGFVILMTAASGSLRRFVVSRIVRLYPAFWACCTITFVIILIIGAPRFTASIKQYLINMTMLSEFVRVPSIDGAYWSLFVEMRFYALVAMVLVIGKINKAQLFLMLWLIASIILEFVPIGKLRYLLLVDWSAYFIAGSTFFLIWSQGISVPRIVMVALCWGDALFNAINRLGKFESHYNTNMNRYAVAGIITSFFFVMLMISIRRTGSWGRSRWLLAGALTYPLYLLHQNIGFMIFNFAYPKVNPYMLFWGTIFVILCTAYIVHVFFEKKLSLQLKDIINNFLDAVLGQLVRFKGFRKLPRTP